MATCRLAASTALAMAPPSAWAQAIVVLGSACPRKSRVYGMGDPARYMAVAMLWRSVCACSPSGKEGSNPCVLLVCLAVRVVEHTKRHVMLCLKVHISIPHGLGKAHADMDLAPIQAIVSNVE